jgi:DNA polymerase III gamma/tau subunit
MPLHIDYRPKSLDHIYGNGSVVASVRSILERQDRPRAWLFTGPSGTGKTTMARIIATAMGCHELDYEERNIADARGIDDARKMMTTMAYMPQGRFEDKSYGTIRVIVLDECQAATRDFQQAILKSLEDTPAHVVFILCTTDPDKLLKTIRTRCTTFEMSLLPGPTMRDLVRDVLTAESVSWPEETMAAVADAITEMAEGSPRQALVALDQVIDLGSQEEMVETLRRTVLDTVTVNELAKALLTRRKWEQVVKLIKGLPASDDPEKVRRYIIAAAEGELLRTGSEQAAIVFDAFQKPFYDNAGKGLVFSAWRSLR